MSKGSPAELQVLAREIGRIAARKRPAAAHALAEQPFDRELLREPLFRKSRELFLKQGGKFRVALVSSPRTLSSPILLENRIDYSPIESELIWAATDPREKRNPAHLATLRTYTSSLFHEQNHRILWKMLPGIPAERRAAGRYLNFVESLVVAADMALGDKMGPKAAAVYYLSGAAYDPGTLIRARLGRARDYRNYLQAALFATYLYLCFYEPREIARALPRLFPELSAADAAHAASRALRLDPGFVHRTNPGWQKTHLTEVIRKFGAGGQHSLLLPDSPTDRLLIHLHAERWFDLLGL